ncbi:MAG: hypothetical protein M1819_006673 [Sarea resinae]|nr:MAG: hypothetical protein M1819_006673 [Sarea resinae]
MRGFRQRLLSQPLSQSLTNLYLDAKTSYETVTRPRELEDDPEFVALHRRLRIQKDRLATWGLDWSDSAALQGGNIDESIQEAGLADVVASVMSSIQEILNDVESKQTSEVSPKGFEDSGKNQPGHRRTETDKLRLEDSIKDLTTSIDTLYDLSRSRHGYHHVGGQQTRPNEKWPALAGKSSQASSLRTDHQDPADLADNEVTLSHDLPSSGLPQLKAELLTTFQSGDTISSLSRPPPYEPVATPSTVRTIGLYHGHDCPKSSSEAGEKECPARVVLIEYLCPSTLDPAASLSAVSSKLQSPDRPSHQIKKHYNETYTGTLNLIGYFKDAQGSRLGLVYDLPHDKPRFTNNPQKFLQRSTPFTLLSLLPSSGSPTNTSVPALEDRLRLAFNLTSTLFRLHAKGIVHRNVNSNNVVFFPPTPPEPATTKSTSSRPHRGRNCNIRTPYLCSIGMLPDPESEHPTNLRPSSIYRHPFEEDNAKAMPSFDIYSLGLILLEIGLWMPLGEFWKMKYTLAMFKSRLQNIYVKKLAAKCGTSYMQAVEDCIAIDGTTNFLVAQDTYTRILGRLERCCLIDGYDSISIETTTKGKTNPEHDGLPIQAALSSEGRDTTSQPWLYESEKRDRINNFPEKCPVPTCPFHEKGFARKSDKNRHTLTHYKGTMFCGFCHGTGFSKAESFTQVDVFKRHLTSIHGVEQSTLNSPKGSLGSEQKGSFSVHPLDAIGKCSICLANFDNAQDLYEHLDDCIFQSMQQENLTPATNKRDVMSIAEAEFEQLVSPQPAAQPHPGLINPTDQVISDAGNSSSSASVKLQSSGNPTACVLDPSRRTVRKLRVYPVKTAPHQLDEWHGVLLPRLERLLEKAVRDPYETVSMDFVSLGETQQKARPTILVTCTSVRDVNNILSRYFTYDNSLYDLKVRRGKIHRSKVSRPKQRSPRRSAGHWKNENEDTSAKNPFHQQRPLCGASIGVYKDSEHLPPVSYGGVILLDGEPFGMTVHHLLETPSDDDNSEDEEDFSIRSSARWPAGLDTDIQDLGSQLQEDDLLDYPIVEFSEDESCYSSTEDIYEIDQDLSDDPNSSEDESGQEERARSCGDTPSIAKGSGGEYVITQPALDDVDDDFFPCPEDRDDDHLDSHTLGHIYASSGLRRWSRKGIVHEIDWAILKVDSERLQPYNLIQGGKRFCRKDFGAGADGVAMCPRLVEPVCRRGFDAAEDLYPFQVVPEEELGMLRVHCLGRTSGLRGGTISPAMSSVRVYGRKTFSRSWAVVGNFGAGGDSGAWVIDNEQARVCGHVMACTYAAC